MADREISHKLYTKHKRTKIKQHKTLQDPKYRAKTEKTKKERERVLETEEAEMEIKEYTK